MRRFVLTVAACLISNAAIAIEKPSNAVAVLATADKRIDWWGLRIFHGDQQIQPAIAIFNKVTPGSNFLEEDLRG